MATGCGDVLSLEDLQIAKKHQLFEAEVITGKTGGIAAGADIDYATNGNTGQVQKTMPAILRDIGFTPASFDFLTGGTIAANQRDLAVLWPTPGGDGDWYYWEGSLPKVIPASSTPATTGGVSNGAWRPVGDITLRGEIEADRPWTSPEFFVSTAGTGYDDALALQSAFNFASTNGVSVKLSKRYISNSNISVSGFYADVFGVNQYTSGITFAPGFGLIIDNSATLLIRKPVKLYDLHLKTKGLRQGIALTFNGNGGVRYAKQLIFRDVDVSSADDGNYSFDTCFKLTRAGQAVFDNVNVSGAGTSLTTSLMGKIFDLNSTKNLNIVNGSFQNFDTFMDAHDDTEGIFISGNHIIAGRRGVVSENNTGNAFWVIDNHFNTTLSAVELGDGSVNGGNHSVIKGNFCIVFNDIAEDATTPYVGIDVCSSFNTIQSNQILRTATTKDSTAIRLKENTAGTRVATANTVSDNIGNQLSRNIVLNAGVLNNNVYGNTRIGISLVNDIIDNGTNTRYWILESDSNRFMTKDIKLCDTGKSGARTLAFYSSTDPNVATANFRVTGGVAGVGNDGTGEFTGITFAVKNLRSDGNNTRDSGATSFRWANSWSVNCVFGATGNAKLTSGTGSPEGVVAAAIGSIYTNISGGTGTTLYVKESGNTGNTGWVAK